MKSSVTIDGVTLTRVQVEQAMKELNRTSFEAGDIVAWASRPEGEQFVVLRGGDTEKIVREKYSCITKASVVMTNGCTTYSPLADSLVKIGTLKQV